MKNNSKRNSDFGKYGLIHLSDWVIHKLEFNAWFTEVKKKNLVELNRQNEKQYFEEFITLYNTANLPHKKYYDLVKYTKKQFDLNIKKNYSISKDKNKKKEK